MEGLPDCGSIMDTFGIDDLLDFSNEDIAGAIGDLDDDTMQQQLSADSSLTTVETVSCNFSAANNNNKSRVSPAAAAPSTGISSLIEKDFCVPYEDMVELEWLSNFVEDSFSAGNASHSNNILGFSTAEEQKQHSGQQQQQQQHQLSSTNNSSKQHHFHILSPVSVLESSATSERATGEAELVLPSKARSKRGRPTTASRVLGSSSSASSSYEEEEETSDAHESDCALSTESDVMTEEHELEWPPRKPPPPKKQCLKESSDGGGGGGGGAAGRRCSHCLTQRTPQWRAGPLGPKTLCNACGVRFKSGRLLPEYRPAGSPTFVADKHSNSHRKVLEMRKQRDEVASTVKRMQEAEGELEEEEVILLS